MLVFEAIKRGIPMDEIHAITMIDRWFLAKLGRLVEFEQSLASGGLSEEAYLEGKKLSYPTACSRASASKSQSGYPLCGLSHGRHLLAG